MSKGTRLIKRALALFLVLLLSIESFGAIVSDNDGSAFITKAEFDSLKNDFQSQIDNYNTSIDSKIDGAIAAYLAGISIKQKGNEDVLYFSTFSENENIVYMRANSDNQSTFGYGPRYGNWGFSSIYTSGFGVTANAYANSNSYQTSKRRFVAYSKSDGSYRWQGYSENYYETITITGFCDAGSADTGYTKSAPYLYAPYTTSYSRTAYSTSNNSGWRFSIAEGGASSPYRSATSVSVSVVPNSYTLNYTKDLIYQDFSADQNWYNANARWHADGNPNGYWWAGSSLVYGTDNYSIGGSARFNISGTYNYNIPNSLYTRTGSANSYYWVSTCPEPTLKRWYKILANDTNKYYDERTAKYIQDYNMCEGMPIISAKKNKEYTWPVKFNNSATIYLKYGKFGTTETAPTTPIKISVSTDGGKTWSAYASSATLTEGIIKFKTDSIGGLIFCKWNNGRGMYKSGSSSMNWVDID